MQLSSNRIRYHLITQCLKRVYLVELHPKVNSEGNREIVCNKNCSQITSTSQRWASKIFPWGRA